LTLTVTAGLKAEASLLARLSRPRILFFIVVVFGKDGRPVKRLDTNHNPSGTFHKSIADVMPCHRLGFFRSFLSLVPGGGALKIAGQKLHGLAFS
jgi:hypothetical protein